jgi:hypothetical protein
MPANQHCPLCSHVADTQSTLIDHLQSMHASVFAQAIHAQQQHQQQHAVNDEQQMMLTQRLQQISALS